MILVISGTNRRGSNSLKVSRLVAGYLEGHPDKPSTQVVDLASLPPDLLGPDVYSEKPPEFAPLADAVLASDGIMVIVPEYNGSFPGILKYFIDLLPFPESFDRRPVSYVGLSAGQWGALRAVEQLQLVFGYRNAYVHPPRTFLPGVHNLLDENGCLKDPSVAERLEKQAHGFVDFCKHFGNLTSGSQSS
jgi:chromate reductase